MSAYEIAGGSVAGTEHVRTGKNNQDAYGWVQEDGVLVAAVADGCGSGAHSEVGARIGVRLVTEALAKHARGLLLTPFSAEPTVANLFDALARTEDDVIRSLGSIVHDMGGNFAETVQEHFLFTVVGAVITPALSATFEFGDGVIGINNAVIPLPQNPANAPPYLGYKLLDFARMNIPPDKLRFLVRWAMSGQVRGAILVGTDGVLDFLNAQAKNLPGKEECLGPLNQFWTQDRYFRNHDMVRRRLAQANKPSLAIDWEKQEARKEQGLLPDDTTLVVIRRVPKTDEGR